MQTKPKHHLKRSVGLMTFVMALAGAAASARAQTVAQLLQPGASRTNLRQLLAAWGDEAVAPTRAAIAAETAASPVRLGVLLNVLRDINTAAARGALTALLGDPRPYVRGVSARLLGEIPAQCSVSTLTTLLDDSREFSRTGLGANAQITTVGDVAAVALGQLTTTTPALTTSERESQYTAWWSANQAWLACGGAQ